MLNKELIKKLSSGEIAVENDGTLEQITLVLKEAFPEDDDFPSVEYSFYFQFSDYPNEWDFGDTTSLPTISVKDFFTVSITELANSFCDTVINDYGAHNYEEALKVVKFRLM